MIVSFSCDQELPSQTSLFPRDGPDQNSPQLGVFSGNTALETAYSSTNQVLLKFHSDFSNGGFFVLNFHGQCILTLSIKAEDSIWFSW